MSRLMPIPGFGWVLAFVSLSAMLQARWPAYWWAQLALLAVAFALKWWDVFGPYPGDKQGREPERHRQLSARRSRWERFILG